MRPFRGWWFGQDHVPRWAVNLTTMIQQVINNQGEQMTSIERLNTKMDVLEATVTIVRTALDDLAAKGQGISAADVDAVTARVDTQIAALQERVAADDPSVLPPVATTPAP